MGCHQALGHLAVTNASTSWGRRGRHAASVATTALLALTLLVAGCRPADVGTIDATTLSKRIAENDAPLVLDVRSEGEFGAGHIPGALNIPHDQLEERLSELPAEKSAEIVVHCQSGVRAIAAERVLAGAGYSNVHDLDGHWAGWSDADLPRE